MQKNKICIDVDTDSYKAESYLNFRNGDIIMKSILRKFGDITQFDTGESEFTK